jgi:hypothetical protein
MNKAVKWGLIVGAVGLLGAGMVWQQLNKPHRDYTGEQPVLFTVPADLLADFQRDPVQSNADYLNEVVQVLGVLSVADSVGFSMEGGVIGNWSKPGQPAEAKVGALVQLKGRVLSYDDLFIEVRMDEVVLVAAK